MWIKATQKLPHGTQECYVNMDSVEFVHEGTPQSSVDWPHPLPGGSTLHMQSGFLLELIEKPEWVTKKCPAD
jgi:hypothetical protein